MLIKNLKLSPKRFDVAMILFINEISVYKCIEL